MISTPTNEIIPDKSCPENDKDEAAAADLLNPNNSNTSSNDKPSSVDKNTKIEEENNNSKSNSIPTTDDGIDNTIPKLEPTNSTTPHSASSSNSTSSCSRQSSNVRTTMGKFKEKRPEPLKLGNPEPLDLSIKSAGNVPSGTHIFDLSSASKLTTLETPRIVWQENEALLTNKARLFSSSTGGASQRVRLSSLAGDSPPMTPSTPFLDLIYSPTIVRSAGLAPHYSTTSLFSNHGDSTSSLQALVLQQYKKSRQFVEENLLSKALASPPSSNGNKHRLPILLSTGNGAQKTNNNSGMIKAAAIAVSSSTPRRSCSTEGLSGLFGSHTFQQTHHYLQQQYHSTKNNNPKSGAAVNTARFLYNSATNSQGKSPTNKPNQSTDQFNNGQQTTGSGIGNNGQALTPTSVANATANLLNIHLNSPKANQQDNSISATQVILNDLLEGNCSTVSGEKTGSINNDQNSLDPLISAVYCQQHQHHSNGRISFSSSSSSTYSALQALHDNHHQDNNSKLSQSSSGSGMNNHHLSSFLNQQTTPTSLTSNGLASLSSSTTLNTPTLISPSQLKTGSICFLPSPTLSPMSSVFELPSPLLMFPPPPMTSASVFGSQYSNSESSRNNGSNVSTNTSVVNQPAATTTGTTTAAMGAATSTTTTTTTTTITSKTGTISSPTTINSGGSKLISSPNFVSETKIMSDPALTSSSSISTAIGASSLTTTTASTTITNRSSEQSYHLQSNPTNDVLQTKYQLAQFPVTTSGIANRYASCSGNVAAVTSKLTGSEMTLSANLEVKQMSHQELGYSAFSEGNLAHLVTSAKEKVGLNVLGDDEDDEFEDSKVQMETEDGEMCYQEENSNEGIDANNHANVNLRNRLYSKQIPSEDSKDSFLKNRRRFTNDRPPASTIPKIFVSDCLHHHHHHQQQQRQQPSQCLRSEWHSQGSINNKGQQDLSDSVFEPEYQLSDVNQNQDPNQPQQHREQRNRFAKRALSPKSFQVRVRLYHNERLASSSAPPDVYQGKARSKIKSAINDPCTNIWSTEDLCPSVTPIVDQYTRCASVLPNQQTVQHYHQQSSQQVNQVTIQPALHQGAGAPGSNHHSHYKPYPDTRHCLGFQQSAPAQYQYQYQQQQQPQPQQQQQHHHNYHQPPQQLHPQQQQQQEQHHHRQNHQHHQQPQQAPLLTTGYLSATEIPCTASSTTLLNRSNSAEPKCIQQLSWGPNQNQPASEQLVMADQSSNHHHHHQHQHQHQLQQQQQSQQFGTHFIGQQVQAQPLASLASCPFASQSVQHLHANFSTSTSPNNNNLLKPLNTNSNNQQLQHLNTSNFSNNNAANHHQHHQQHYVSQHQQQSNSAGDLHRLPMTSCSSGTESNVFTGSSQMLAPKLSQVSCARTHSSKFAATVVASCLSTAAAAPPPPPTTTTAANNNQVRDHHQQRLPIQQQQQQQHLLLATSELDNKRHQSGLGVLGRNPSSFAPNHSGQVQGHVSHSRLHLSNATTTSSSNNADHLPCQSTQHEQQQHHRNRQQRHLERVISVDQAKAPSLVSNATNQISRLLVTGATTTTTTCTNTTSGSAKLSTMAIATPSNLPLVDSLSSHNSTSIINNKDNNFGQISASHFRSSSAQPLQTNSSGAVKKYRCDQCLKAFTRSDMLTRHKRLHSGDKPFMCNECRQEFSRSDHLSTHMRTHTGEKPYKCKLCAYSACRKDMITRHMKVHNRSSPNTLESGGAASR